MKPISIFWGKIKKGQNRGKKLGFPTANISLHKKISEGIYASEIFVKSKKYKAAVFIGSAKTYGEKDYKAEIYILDFNQNIYGKWISVKLFEKTRENKKFNSEKDLITQMNKDIDQVRKILK